MKMQKKPDYLFRIQLIGDSYSRRDVFMQRYVDESFKTDYTIGKSILILLF